MKNWFVKLYFHPLAKIYNSIAFLSPLVSLYLIQYILQDHHHHHHEYHYHRHLHLIIIITFVNIVVMDHSIILIISGVSRFTFRFFLVLPLLSTSTLMIAQKDEAYHILRLEIHKKTVSLFDLVTS